LGVIFTFFSTNLLLAQDPIISPPPCIGNECTDLVWHYDSMTVFPGNINQNIDSNCSVRLYYKEAYGCGKCYIYITAYKLRFCPTITVSKSIIINYSIACYLLQANQITNGLKCVPTITNPCVNNIRIFSGSCKQEFNYYNTPGHDPNGNSVAFVTDYNPWNLVGPTPNLIPILPGEKVYINCSPTCCKATFNFCAFWNQEQTKVIYTISPILDQQTLPDCSNSIPNNTLVTNPCVPDCWFSDSSFTFKSPYYN
jgi:hypothetical protein